MQVTNGGPHHQASSPSSLLSNLSRSPVGPIATPPATPRRPTPAPSAAAPVLPLRPRAALIRSAAGGSAPGPSPLAPLVGEFLCGFIYEELKISHE